MCPSVKYPSYWSKRLLSSLYWCDKSKSKKYLTYRIPNLQFDDLIINLDTEWAELYSYGYLMLLFELVVHDSFH